MARLPGLLLALSLSAPDSRLTGGAATSARQGYVPLPGVPASTFQISPGDPPIERDKQQRRQARAPFDGGERPSVAERPSPGGDSEDAQPERRRLPGVE